MENVILPICICVILPIAIVLIVKLSSMYKCKNRTKVLLAAIETGQNINSDKLAEFLQESTPSPREIANRRLLWGCICFLIGVVFLVFGGAIINSYEKDSLMSIIIGGIAMAIGISFIIVYFVSLKQIPVKDQE